MCPGRNSGWRTFWRSQISLMKKQMDMNWKSRGVYQSYGKNFIFRQNIFSIFLCRKIKIRKNENGAFFYWRKLQKENNPCTDCPCLWDMPEWVLPYFQEILKTSPMEYVNTVRIQNSLNALKNKKNPLQRLRINPAFPVPVIMRKFLERKWGAHLVSIGKSKKIEWKFCISADFFI